MVEATTVEDQADKGGAPAPAADQGAAAAAAAADQGAASEQAAEVQPRSIGESLNEAMQEVVSDLASVKNVKGLSQDALADIAAAEAKLATAREKSSQVDTQVESAKVEAVAAIDGAIGLLQEVKRTLLA